MGVEIEGAMIANGTKTNWSKGTVFNRSGAKKGCSSCHKHFGKKELFSIREVTVSWFRGDDEVDFYCLECTPAPIRKILKMK